MSCDRFKDRVGFKGQAYIVVATPADGGPEQGIGWQNEPTGGLADMVNVHHWPQFQANSARVVRACQKCGGPEHEGNCVVRNSLV